MLKNPMEIHIESYLHCNRHTIGDGDGGQAGAIFECTASYACHTIGDGNGSQTTAISIF